MSAILNEFFDYIAQFNPLSKQICKLTCAILFALLLLAMYFALAAGRTMDYYYCMGMFDIITDNIRSVAGIGFFFSLLLEPVCKKQSGQEG